MGRARLTFKGVYHHVMNRGTDVFSGDELKLDFLKHRDDESWKYKLAVNGKIRAKEIEVETGCSDFVFADNYQLMPLDKLAHYIKVNRSLPVIPKEKYVVKEGVALGEMHAKLLEKVVKLVVRS